MLRFSRWLLVLMLLVAGCSNASENESKSEKESSTPTVSETTSGTNEQQASPQQPQPASKESTSKDAPNLDGIWPKPLAESRKSLKGNWVVNLFLSGREVPIILLKVDTDKENTLSATVLDVPNHIEKVNLISSKMTKTSVNVELRVESRQIPFDQVGFQGTLKDGIVIGNVLLNEIGCIPARLIATDDSSVPTTIQPQTEPFYEELLQAIETFKSNGSIELFRGFVNDHPESPSAIDIFVFIISQAAKGQLKVEDVEKLAEKYLATSERWGPRMKTFAYMQVGGNLADTRYLPATALKYLDKLEKRLAEDSPKPWKLVLENSKKNVEVTFAISSLSHENEAIRKKSVESVRQHQTEQPFNHRLLFALADYYEKQNQPDQAINWYAQLTVLPLMERILNEEWDKENIDHRLPSEALAELWKKKHGKTGGLDDYLNEVYEKSVFSFLSKNTDPRTPNQGNRVILCELFTGALCPPCIAADIATGALEKTYPLSEVVVLRYHQHIPGPDQLTNQDSEARAGYYEIRGTPSVLLSGKMFPNPTGFIDDAENVFNNLREAVDSQLSEKTELSLKLSANADDGTLNLSAEVDGLENPADSLRLRLVLAEDEILFPAGNGIRKHEMIVRSMPGGFRGIAPKEGKLSFSKSIKLSDMKQKLMDYLAAYEEGNSFEFPVKPLALDKLHLVAFVQDDITREVLQAAAIPVTGKLEYPNPPQPGPPTQKQTGNNEKKPVEAAKPE
jgi:hypothetical protein